MTGDTLTIALAQLSIEPTAVSENLDRAARAIEQSAKRGADLVVLPELFTVGYFAFDEYQEVAEGLDGPTLRRLESLARELDIAIVAGTIVEDLSLTDHPDSIDDGGLANTSVLIDATGEQRLVYRKQHLFGYESAERELLQPGETLAVTTIGGFTVAITTCYDLRFPELYRRFVDLGATLVLVPSAWPYPRIEHWETLARARAVENLCYVAAANGTGSFEAATLLGRSTVYDPWGVPIAAAGDEPTIVTATIDPDRVDSIRDRFPVLDHRRY